MRSTLLHKNTTIFSYSVMWSKLCLEEHRFEKSERIDCTSFETNVIITALCNTMLQQCSTSSILNFERRQIRFGHYFNIRLNMSKWRCWFQTLQKLSNNATWKTTLKFGCLFTGSEWTQQVVIYKVWNGSWHSPETRLPLDWASIGRYAIWGFAIFPHILRRWYTLLDRVVVGATPWKVALKKTAVDQAIFPIPILGSFYVFLSALEGKNDSLESLFEECNVKLWATLKARYCFMLPTQVRIFSF